VNRFDALPHIAARYARRRARYVDNGLWPDETLASAFARAATEHPDQQWTFLIDGNTSTYPFAELADHAWDFAGRLSAVGLKPDDPVVAVALPNAPGAVSACYGAMAAGWVAFPVSMREGNETLSELLETVGVHSLVVAADDEQRIGWAREFLAAGRLRQLWLAAENGAIRPADPGPGNIPYPIIPPVSDGVHVITYTSGSTQKPKVVLYTDAQLIAESDSLRDVFAGWGAVLVPSPVGHITGILHLLTIPLRRPADVVAMDKWNPEVAVDLCRKFGAECLAGTSLYYQAMGNVSPDLGGLRGGMAGGGPVAPIIAERLQEHGIRLVRSYGSTEHPTITQSRGDDPLADRGYTDGRPNVGIELRLVDEEGRPVAIGSPGEIFSRGPDAMAGYLEVALDAEADEDWVRTGDVGIIDEQGRLTISDRVKDIVIRGAENISAKEVEDVVFQWDAVEEASLIGVPDAMYGERACIYVIAKRPVTLDDLKAYLATTRLEKFKWPEYLVALDDDFPRSASGKVRKQTLREMWAKANT
jgi:acyl-CoA synthetase (AMP-forming)/AMP-acid ligase II